MTMQERLERAAAYVEIVDVINRYGAAIDAGDWKRLRSCFTPDAKLTLGTNLLVGPDAIAEYIAGAVVDRAWQQHLLGSHQVAVDGDRATATCSLYATQFPKDPEKQVVTTIGTYHDELRLTDDGWKIAQRVLRTYRR
jgi:ketosteroid isomerase-like protein